MVYDIEYHLLLGNYSHFIALKAAVGLLARIRSILASTSGVIFFKASKLDKESSSYLTFLAPIIAVVTSLNIFIGYIIS